MNPGAGHKRLTKLAGEIEHLRAIESSDQKRLNEIESMLKVMAKYLEEGRIKELPELEQKLEAIEAAIAHDIAQAHMRTEQLLYYLQQMKGGASSSGIHS